MVFVAWTSFPKRHEPRGCPARKPCQRGPASHKAETRKTEVLQKTRQVFGSTKNTESPKTKLKSHLNLWQAAAHLMALPFKTSRINHCPVRLSKLSRLTLGFSAVASSQNPSGNLWQLDLCHMVTGANMSQDNLPKVARSQSVKRSLPVLTRVRVSICSRVEGV